MDPIIRPSCALDGARPYARQPTCAGVLVLFLVLFYAVRRDTRPGIESTGCELIVDRDSGFARRKPPRVAGGRRQAELRLKPRRRSPP